MTALSFSPSRKKQQLLSGWLSFDPVAPSNPIRVNDSVVYFSLTTLSFALYHGRAALLRCLAAARVTPVFCPDNKFQRRFGCLIRRACFSA
jgi:hypothetical protein